SVLQLSTFNLQPAPLLIAASAVFLASTAIFARLAYADGMDPRTFLAVRFIVAAVPLVILAAARRVTFPKGKPLLGLILMGSVGVARRARARPAPVRERRARPSRRAAARRGVLRVPGPLRERPRGDRGRGRAGALPAVLGARSPARGGQVRAAALRTVRLGS